MCFSIYLDFDFLSFPGESKSVYVRNLPSTVSSLDILQEFKNFGKIKQDGVFLRNRKVSILNDLLILFLVVYAC